MNFSLLLPAFCVSVCIATAVGASAHAQPAKAPAAEGAAKGVGAAELTTIKASVEAVDQRNRIVTLKGPRGNVFSVPVSERVQNLPQVKAGDVVEVVHYEAVAVEVKRTEAAPALTETTMADRAQPGERPAGVALRKVRVVTNVLGVNTDNQTVLVRGPLGHLAEVKVRDPKLISDLQAGGQIDLTYVEGLAIEVRSAAGK